MFHGTAFTYILPYWVIIYWNWNWLELTRSKMRKVWSGRKENCWAVFLLKIKGNQWCILYGRTFDKRKYNISTCFWGKQNEIWFSMKTRTERNRFHIWGSWTHSHFFWFIYFLIICPPPELLPVLVPWERWCATYTGRSSAV